MQATAVPFSETSDQTSEWRVIEPVIELAITQANAQGAYVYRFDQENVRATLSAFVGPAPVNREVSGPPARLHFDRRTPIVLQDGAATDWRFAELPEFKGGRFEGVVSVPLVDQAEVVGMASFCRIRRAAFRPTELAFLLGLSLPLGALLTTSTLREELQKTTQLLADRKLLERAKGLLQESLGWTEEEAYLQIRRLSRQQRTPMRNIARQLIQAGEIQAAEIQAGEARPQGVA
jgi:GAF domain-containing protein